MLKQFYELFRKDNLMQQAYDRSLEMLEADREMFLAAFTEVQRHFSDLFRKCFSGGKAELHLEEGVDVLEAGIDDSRH